MSISSTAPALRLGQLHKGLWLSEEALRSIRSRGARITGGDIIAKERITPNTLAGLEITRVKERSQFYNILIYGQSGTGKTTLAGSADAVPSLRPVLFVDIEGGTTSLTHSYPDVETVRVTTWKEMQELYNELHRGGHGYSTIVLDSLTEIQKFNMYNVMAEASDKRENVDVDVPAMRDWGVSLEQTRRMVRGFRDLQMNTIFTALSKEDKNARTGKTSILPSLPGKLAGEVAAFLDIVVYYYVREVDEEDGKVQKRLLLTQKTDEVVAKDRSGRLPQVIEAPTMTEIHKIMTTTKIEPVKEEAPNDAV